MCVCVGGGGGVCVCVCGDMCRKLVKEKVLFTF